MVLVYLLMYSSTLYRSYEHIYQKVLLTVTGMVNKITEMGIICKSFQERGFVHDGL